MPPPLVVFSSLQNAPQAFARRDLSRHRPCGPGVPQVRFCLLQLLRQPGWPVRFPLSWLGALVSPPLVLSRLCGPIALFGRPQSLRPRPRTRATHGGARDRVPAPLRHAAPALGGFASPAGLRSPATPLWCVRPTDRPRCRCRRRPRGRRRGIRAAPAQRGVRRRVAAAGPGRVHRPVWRTAARDRPVLHAPRLGGHPGAAGTPGPGAHHLSRGAGRSGAWAGAGATAARAAASRRADAVAGRRGHRRKLGHPHEQWQRGPAMAMGGGPDTRSRADPMHSGVLAWPADRHRRSRRQVGGCPGDRGPIGFSAGADRRFDRDL